MSKISLLDIKRTLEEQHWTVLSDTYTNLQTQMSFKCPEGHSVYTSWGKLRNKIECPVCKANKAPNELIDYPKSVGARRIIALDQASHITGYAIFDDGKLIHYGTFKTTMSDEIARCAQIKYWLISLIHSLKPDFIGLEGIQYQDEASGQKMGITVFQTLARLQGILMETCYTEKVPYKICPTNTWRHECGVKGKSRVDRKRSMQLLVKQWYDVTVSDDEADAIGIGRHLVTFVQKNTEMTNWET